MGADYYPLSVVIAVQSGVANIKTSVKLTAENGATIAVNPRITLPSGLSMDIPDKYDIRVVLVLNISEERAEAIRFMRNKYELGLHHAKELCDAYIDLHSRGLINLDGEPTPD